MDGNGIQIFNGSILKILDRLHVPIDVLNI